MGGSKENHVLTLRVLCHLEARRGLPCLGLQSCPPPKRDLKVLPPHAQPSFAGSSFQSPGWRWGRQGGSQVSHGD